MNKIVIILMLGLLGTGLYGQNPQAKEKIESARIGFLTKRMGLTPDQAERFWPLYNEFITKREDAAREFKQFQAGLDTDAATEAQSRRLVELELETKQRRLDLEKDYSKRLLSVISTQQIASLRQAERDFRGILLRRLQQARQQNIRENLRDRDQIRDRVRDKYRD